jgi:hypothetical protein
MSTISRGTLDVQLHEIDQDNAAGDEADLCALLSRRGLGGRLESLIDSSGLVKLKLSMIRLRVVPCGEAKSYGGTCSTAATMLE